MYRLLVFSVLLSAVVPIALGQSIRLNGMTVDKPTAGASKAAAENTGAAKWKVPKSTKGKGYKIRLTSNDILSIMDENDGAFKFVNAE